MNLAVVNEAVTGMNGVEHEFTEEEKNFVVQFLEAPVRGDYGHIQVKVRYKACVGGTGRKPACGT